jgi:hypothetical protein
MTERATGRLVCEDQAGRELRSMAQSERYHPAAPGTRLGELPGPLDGRVAIVTGAAGGLGAALDAFTAAGLWCLPRRQGYGAPETPAHA